MASVNLTYFNTITIEGEISGRVNCGLVGLPDGGIQVGGSSTFTLTRVDRDFDSPVDPGANEFQLCSIDDEEFIFAPSPFNAGKFVTYIPENDFGSFTCLDDNYSNDTTPGLTFAEIFFNIQATGPVRKVQITPEGKVKVTPEPKVQIRDSKWIFGMQFSFTLGCVGPHPFDDQSCYPELIAPSIGDEVNSLLGLVGSYTASEHQTYLPGCLPGVCIGEWDISQTTTFA